jgi:hypothetical protein
MTKRKRARVNKQKLRRLRAREAQLKHYIDELKRANVNDTTITEAAKALHVILTTNKK